MNKVCFLDGNALCIVNKDFINLQESRSMFIELSKEQIKEFNNLNNKLSKKIEELVEEKKKRGEKLI